MNLCDFSSEGLNSRAMTEQKNKPRHVSVTRLSLHNGDTADRLSPASPLHTTFHTIKPVIYIAMVIYFVLRERMKLFCQVLVLFLSSFINDPVLRPCIKKSCSSMSFINFIMNLFLVHQHVYLKKSLWQKIERKEWNSAFCITGILCMCQPHIVTV